MAVTLAGRTHGHHATYSRGCRCQPCTDAHAAVQRAWRQRATKTACACGGLLAEDEAGRVACLSCGEALR